MQYLRMLVCLVGGLGLLGCRDYIDLADEDEVHGAGFSMNSDEGAGVDVVLEREAWAVGEKPM